MILGITGHRPPSVQGSKNHNWKGGLTGWRKLARGRLNEHFVRPVMERDSFTCQWCNSKKQIVVHHHKRSFMEIVNIIEGVVNRNDIEEFVNAIVNEHTIDDGITLCKLCHDKYHKENGK
jgi:5-methylcytosine-specific restriction endonuclease McrA